MVLKVKVERMVTLCLKEDTAMKDAKSSREAPDLVTLVNEIIAYWKAIAERGFKNARPFSDPSEFERDWPKTLDNFFLAETVRTAKLLRSLPSEGRDN
jgi:hypothetical protein